MSSYLVSEVHALKHNNKSYGFNVEHGTRTVLSQSLYFLSILNGPNKVQR
jgi:hypothetical protein